MENSNSNLTAIWEYAIEKVAELNNFVTASGLEAWLLVVMPVFFIWQFSSDPKDRTTRWLNRFFLVLMLVPFLFWAISYVSEKLSTEEDIQTWIANFSSWFANLNQKDQYLYIFILLFVTYIAIAIIRLIYRGYLRLRRWIRRKFIPSNIDLHLDRDKKGRDEPYSEKEIQEIREKAKSKL